MKREVKNERPEAYPKPTQTDQQLKNQNEFTETESSRRSEDQPPANKRSSRSENISDREHE